MKLNFKKTQKNDDATYNYNVTWNEPNATVDDICDAILAHAIQAKEEHGDIYISMPSDRWHEYIADYSNSIMEFHDTYFDYENVG